MKTKHPQPRSFAEADPILGRKESRKIHNNTWLHRLSDDAIAVRLHNTNIVRFERDGSVTLNSGGWRTVTIKRRMNDYLPRPYGVGQTKGEWYLYKDHVPQDYRDGLVVETLAEDAASEAAA